MRWPMTLRFALEAAASSQLEDLCLPLLTSKTPLFWGYQMLLRLPSSSSAQLILLNSLTLPVNTCTPELTIHPPIQEALPRTEVSAGGQDSWVSSEVGGGFSPLACTYPHNYIQTETPFCFRVTVEYCPVYLFLCLLRVVSTSRLSFLTSIPLLGLWTLH